MFLQDRLISKLISDLQFVIIVQIYPRFFFQLGDLLFTFSTKIPHHHFFGVHHF